MATRRSKAKRHFVALRKKNGGLELHPLKDWVRTHPKLDPRIEENNDLTSHQLRDGLKRKGWTVEQVVICIRPES